MSEGKSNYKKKQDGQHTNTYLKVLTIFKCNNENCAKKWKSAHGWYRNETHSKCNSCGRNSKLINAAEEQLKLDYYNCPNEKCQGNSWAVLHTEGRIPRECNKCHEKVFPEKHPQERYGWHYWFQCVNKECKNPQKNEDFSTEPIYTQRCNKCFSTGTIIGIERKYVPVWLIQRRREEAQVAGRSTTHNATLCEMCQKIIREGKGISCHDFRKVVTNAEEIPGGGNNDFIITIF